LSLAPNLALRFWRPFDDDKIRNKMLALIVFVKRARDKGKRFVLGEIVFYYFVREQPLFVRILIFFYSHRDYRGHKHVTCDSFI